ncbi:T9SS type A sorting domain-containing protein [Mucilaginibacter sp.]|uniref:T9SS type A sorting domain-containing protein n=1 Tax=Mucilaginibacter sp. TaxID=1882438 RepID=UPI0025D7C9CF|nr:T9SS type A sorting domain-containing protein [Mucilaginibacter sp.]
MKTKNNIISLILGLIVMPSFLFAQGMKISSNAYVIANSGYVVVTGNVANSGALNLQTGSFTMSGNYTNSNAYTQGSGNIVFNGQNQVLIDNGSGTMFTNVFFSGNGGSGSPAVMSSGNFSVSSQGVLQMVNATSLNANGNLTLNSDITGSATVAAIPSGSTITNNVNVQRYISGGASKYRGYRFLSSQVYTAKVGSNYYFDLSYLSSYAPITGSLGAAGGMSKTGNPTIYLYRGDILFSNGSFNGGNFRGINKINNSTLYSVGVDYDGSFNLYAGTGFWFFYRGDLTNISTKYFSTTIPESNTFVSKGTLNQQTVTFVHWYTGLSNLQYAVVAGNPATYVGYNMVGNPYASSIDWDTFSATISTAGIYGPQVNKTIYIYNEATKIYGTYDGTFALNGASDIIPSGQGFYVQAKDATAQLIFHESAKTNVQATGSNLLLSKKPVNSGPVLQYVRMAMSKDSDNIEEAVIRFENTAKDEFVIDEDSKHMAGTGGVNFSSYTSDNITASINDIPLPKKSQTKIRLYVSTTADGLYKIEKTELKNLPDIYEVWLMDAYKKDSLDIKHNSVYQFNILRSDTNSWGANRFSLVIRQNKALGLHLLNFAATKATKGAELVWKTENEENYTNFTVERSSNNGKTFNIVGGYVSSSEGTYSLVDKSPPVGTDLYRLKLEDLNGAITYSNIVTLVYGNGNNSIAGNINVYPNPASGVINLAINQSNVNSTDANSSALKTLSSTVATPATAASQLYDIKIISIAGSVITTTTSSQPTWQNDISHLMPGTYIIQVTNGSDKSLVGKATFIKL